MTEKTNKSKPSLIEALGSVLAAMFGVQSSKNRERDFSYSNPWVYIVLGIIMTVLFVLTVWGVVRLVLAGG
jgi:hypothetical protein